LSRFRERCIVRLNRRYKRVGRLLRRDERTKENIARYTFAITFVTVAEIQLGILKARNPIAAYTECLEALRDVAVLHVSGKTPATYAQTYFGLEQRGTIIPVNDIWIAAIALETGLPLLARDEHFSRVQGLRVIQC